MPSWLRIDQTLPDHPKTIALEQRLHVEDGWRFLVHLWNWALDNREEGKLGEIPVVVVARAARWTGDPDLFFRTLLEVGFIERNGTGFVLHNWMKRQGKLINDRLRKRASKDSPSTEGPRNGGGKSAEHSTEVPHPTGNGKRKTGDERPVLPPGAAAAAPADVGLTLTPPGPNKSKGRRRGEVSPRPEHKRLIAHYVTEFTRTQGSPPPRDSRLCRSEGGPSQSPVRGGGEDRDRLPRTAR